MQLFPAIDLRQGRCVRLTQGRYQDETRYSDDPLAVARGFAEQGAEWLHLVDLDGARDPQARQLPLIRALVLDSGLKVQTGGGIRTEEQVVELLELGCQRVIVGSLAVKVPETVSTWLRRFGGERIVLALDVQIDAGGTARVAASGWQETSSASLDAVIAYFLPAGLMTVLCTDIGRDGLLCGPNLELYQGLRTRYPDLGVLASGGVASLDDLRTLRETGVTGVITGKALYEGRFSVGEAAACLRGA